MEDGKVERKKDDRVDGMVEAKQGGKDGEWDGMGRVGLAEWAMGRVDAGRRTCSRIRL